MRNLVACTLLLLLLCATPSFAQSPVSPEKAAAVRRLLTLTGTEKLAHQMVDQMFSSIQASQPNVPAAVWTKMRAKFADSSFTDKLVPIYAQSYTLQDLNGMIAFYQTPLGQKIIATTPLITQQSIAVGQQWGQEKAAEVMEELQKEQSGKATKASTQ